jgi:hypothetical protein
MEVLLVVQAVCASLDHANLIVEFFLESEGDLILWLAVGGNPSQCRSIIFINFS